MRQPLVAASRRDHAESGRARPVHQIADERWLIAVGKAVDDARLSRALREQRPAEGIGLHGDHDHVLAVAESRERMLHRRYRIAGGLDHDVDRGMRHERLPIFRDVRRALLERPFERSRPVRLGRPSYSLQIHPSVGRREIGDARQVHAGRARHLREIHRRELAGADQAYAQRPAVGLTPREKRVQVHSGSRPAGIRSA